jgi:hypothetical protein
VPSLHEIAVSLHIKIGILENKKITVGNIATAVKKCEIESTIVEKIINEIDSEQVEKYCGNIHLRGNGDKRFQRAGTCGKNPVTSVGRLNLNLHKVKDNEAERTFKPIEEIVEFHGKKVYQEDITMIGVELATKMTYRDTVKEGKLFLNEFPSASTLNMRVIEYGEKISELHQEEIKNADIEIAFADGTKTHTQEKGKSKNEINVVLGNKNGNKVLMDVKVNRSWEDSARYLDENNALNEKAVIVGDADKEMRNALVNGNREFQMDLIHAFRLTGFKLWQDGEMTLYERKELIKTIEFILFPLKNSVEKHINDGNVDALGERINFTVDELKRISEDLYKSGCVKAADFIREYSNFIVTFARLAIEGRKVPWNSNIIERLMGEISKRAKHKWMRWTTRGLEAIMRIILTRYSCERIYETFKGNMMKNENLNYIKCEVNVIPVRGEL